MNKIILIGNLTRDPELRTVDTSAGPVSVCSFSVAVNRRNGQQEQTDYFNVTAWRALGENCSRYLAKGRKVYVSGPVSARTYQAQDGTTRISMDVVAGEVEFLSSRGDGAAMAQNPNGASAPAPARVDSQSGMEQVDFSTDELPF